MAFSIIVILVIVVCFFFVCHWAAIYAKHIFVRCFDVCKCVCVRSVCRPVNSIELALERVSFEQQNSFRNAKELANDEKITRAHTHTHTATLFSLSLPFSQCERYNKYKPSRKANKNYRFVCVLPPLLYTRIGTIAQKKVLSQLKSFYLGI